MSSDNYNYRINEDAISNVRNEQGTIDKNAVRTGGCPPGTILRKSYKKRQGKKNRTIRVKAACIKDRGLPGTFADRFPGEKGIGRIEPGVLGHYGYEPDYRDPVRRGALRDACAVIKPLSIFRRLNALAVLTKQTDPARSAIYLEDRDWVKRHFMRPT